MCACVSVCLGWYDCLCVCVSVCVCYPTNRPTLSQYASSEGKTPTNKICPHAAAAHTLWSTTAAACCLLLPALVAHCSRLAVCERTSFLESTGAPEARLQSHTEIYDLVRSHDCNYMQFESKEALNSRLTASFE